MAKKKTATTEEAERTQPLMAYVTKEVETKVEEACKKDGRSKSLWLSRLLEKHFGIGGGK